MKQLTKRQAEEIESIKNVRDEDIDLSDIPETTDWSNAVRGKFYRPVKKSVTVRLDADVLAWLKSKGEGYQTRLNAMLRQMMERDA
jgi:uncharacterized protein (DUF4415 family)